MTVTPEERNDAAPPEDGGQLAWERRFGPWVGAAGALATLFIIISFAMQLSVLRDKTKNEAGTLRSVHKHGSSFVGTGIFQMLALLCVMGILIYFYRATKHRRPQTPTITLVLSIVGPIVFGIAGILAPLAIKHVATEFVNGTNQSNQHAKDLVNSGTAKTFSFVAQFGSLSFAFPMVMTNVNSIRTGLLNTFSGVIGVIAGVLFVLPLGPPQLLMVFWLVAVTLICLDKWPGGRGPAWASGTAVKWPTAMEKRGMAPGATRGATPRRRGRGRAPEPEPQREITLDDSVDPSQSRTSKKRKRKQGRKH
ncbi:MAG TPA: DUF4386 family protein [Thermoleophilaceae bacterium]